MPKFMVGIDEVGRGPLAGPMTVAAVAFNGASDFFDGIKDSKKLTAKKRVEWARRIRSEESGIGLNNIAIVSIPPAMIDKIGISASLRLAVERCLDKLSKNMPQNSEFDIKLDGSLHAPAKYAHQETIIKGDEKIPVISAASIVAKVCRDKYMEKMHEKYPEYGFDKHVGYGTAFHIAAIKEHGLSPLHRRSFCTNFIKNA